MDDIKDELQNCVRVTGLGEAEIPSHSSILETCLRIRFARAISSFTRNQIENFVDQVHDLANSGCIDANTPYWLLEDLVELCDIIRIEETLEIIQFLVKKWKEALSSSHGPGLILLRSVNSFRKRVPKAKCADLAGKALMLLSAVFPASERSGINLKGDKNHDNMSLKSLSDNRFWSFMRHLYSSSYKSFDASEFKNLQADFDLVFKTIENHLASEAANFDSIDVFNSFALHHLMAADIFNVQLSNRNFRVSVLIQLLIFCLDATETSKTTLKLVEAQNSWLSEVTRRSFSLLSQHQDGRRIFEHVRFMLRNERNWMVWKQNSCFSLDLVPVAIAPNYSTESSISCPQIQSFGHPELARLFSNSRPDALIERKLKPTCPEIISQDEPEFLADYNWKHRKCFQKIAE